MFDHLEQRWKVSPLKTLIPSSVTDRDQTPVRVEEGLESFSTVSGEHVFLWELCRSEVIKSPEQLWLNAVQSEWAEHTLSIGRKIEVLFGLEFSVCQMILNSCKFPGSPCRKGRDNLWWSERLLSKTLWPKMSQVCIWVYHKSGLWNSHK